MFFSHFGSVVFKMGEESILEFSLKKKVQFNLNRDKNNKIVH